jgi:hypothetical protein
MDRLNKNFGEEEKKEIKDLMQGKDIAKLIDFFRQSC